MNHSTNETNLILVEKNFPLQRISDGFIIHIDENVLKFGYRFCQYTSWDGESAVAKQILSEIMVDGVGSLKAEMRDVKEERYSHPYVQVLVNPASSENNLLRKLQDEFPTAYFFLRVRYYPYGNYGDYSESSVMDFYGDWEGSAYDFSPPMHEPRNYKFGTWQASGIINFKLECRIENASIYPSEYLKKLESDSEMEPVAFPNFKGMLEDGALSDAVIVAKNGAEVRCHREVLEGCSPVLRAMFQCGMKESQTGRVDMTDMSEEGLRAFLRCLYYEDKEVVKADPGILFEVLCKAHMYDMPRLQVQMIQCLLEKEDKEFSAEVAFDIYMFVRNIRLAFLLKMKVARFMNENWPEVDALPEYVDLVKNRWEDAKALHDDVKRSTLE